jgi:hypothetical protein
MDNTQLYYLGIVFPVLSAVAFLTDAILFVIFHNPVNEKQKNYAGLLSTIFILFYYYQQLLQRPIMAYIFVCYAIIGTVWIFIIGYLKYKGYHQYMYIVTIGSLFHLMSMLEQLMIIFIPVFGSHEVITTNSIAFFYSL